MKRKKYTFKNVVEIDQFLYQLALYEVTRGRISILNSNEKSMELRKVTADKFNYFKGLIQAGECTLEYIQDAVLRKNGPFASSSFKLESDHDFDLFMEEIEDNEVERIEDEQAEADAEAQEYFEYFESKNLELCDPNIENDPFDIVEQEEENYEETEETDQALGEIEIQGEEDEGRATGYNGEGTQEGQSDDDEEDDLPF